MADLFLTPGVANEEDEEGRLRKGIEIICGTNLHDRQAFPLGKAFLLSRFSALSGNMQTNWRLATVHGPHLGARPSHFWLICEFRGWWEWVGINTHNFSCPVGAVGDVSDIGTEGEGEH